MTNDYALLYLLAECDPVTYEKAVQEAKLQKAINEEIETIRRNDTWELTTLPEGHKPIRVNWVLRQTN